MMVLYSGTTCPFSQRCRFVLFEKGMDFEIRDVDLYNKPEDIAVMNPYGQVPILVERDLVLYESNIINEYIDERFPHPQLMPADPVMRARARLFLFNFEKELFIHAIKDATALFILQDFIKDWGLTKTLGGGYTADWKFLYGSIEHLVDVTIQSENPQLQERAFLGTKNTLYPNSPIGLLTTKSISCFYLIFQR